MERRATGSLGECKSKPQFVRTSDLLAKIKKTEKITTVGDDMEKLNSSYIASENIKWCSHCAKQSAVPPKVKHRV